MVKKRENGMYWYCANEEVLGESAGETMSTADNTKQGKEHD